MTDIHKEVSLDADAFASVPAIWYDHEMIFFNDLNYRR